MARIGYAHSPRRNPLLALLDRVPPGELAMAGSSRSLSSVDLLVAVLATASEWRVASGDAGEVIRTGVPSLMF